jgi:hypothetical protein
MANTTKLTVKTARVELEKLVSLYNSSEDVKVLSDTKTKIDEMVKSYNELSVNDAYGRALKAKDTHPILALAKQYKYRTVSVKVNVESVPVGDDEYKIVNTAEVKEGARELDMFAFIEFAAKAKKPVTASPDWKAEVIKSRVAIEDQWKALYACNKNEGTVSINAMKKALQSALDAIVFVPTPKGKNSLVITKEYALRIFGFSNKREGSKELNSFNVNYRICDAKEFNKNFFDNIKDVVKNNVYKIVYCTEEVAEEASSETPAETATAETAPAETK